MSGKISNLVTNLNAALTNVDHAASSSPALAVPTAARAGAGDERVELPSMFPAFDSANAGVFSNSPPAKTDAATAAIFESRSLEAQLSEGQVLLAAKSRVPAPAVQPWQAPKAERTPWIAPPSAETYRGVDPEGVCSAPSECMPLRHTFIQHQMGKLSRAITDDIKTHYQPIVVAEDSYNKAVDEESAKLQKLSGRDIKHGGIARANKAVKNDFRNGMKEYREARSEMKSSYHRKEKADANLRAAGFDVEAVEARAEAWGMENRKAVVERQRASAGEMRAAAAKGAEALATGAVGGRESAGDVAGAIAEGAVELFFDDRVKEYDTVIAYLDSEISNAKDASVKAELGSVRAKYEAARSEVKAATEDYTNAVVKSRDSLDVLATLEHNHGCSTIFRESVRSFDPLRLERRPLPRSPETRPRNCGRPGPPHLSTTGGGANFSS